MAENTQPGRGHQSPQFDFDENLYNLSGEFGRNTGKYNVLQYIEIKTEKRQATSNVQGLQLMARRHADLVHIMPKTRRCQRLIPNSNIMLSYQIALSIVSQLVC